MRNNVEFFFPPYGSIIFLHLWDIFVQKETIFFLYSSKFWAWFPVTRDMHTKVFNTGFAWHKSLRKVRRPKEAVMSPNAKRDENRSDGKTWSDEKVVI